jgi:hypothetical protein
MAHTATTVPSVSSLAWNFYIVGIAVLAFAAAALMAFRLWEEWVTLALGAWLLISPWILGFTTSDALMWNAIIIGAIVIVLSAWTLSQEQRTGGAVRPR